MHEDDWQEELRRIVARFFRGRVYENQYVGTVKMNEEQLEKAVFHPGDVQRNLPAYWKYHADDGRDSEGSWRMTHWTHPEYVERGHQLHITIFRNAENPDYIDIYAHYEVSWSYDPIKHLREIGFSPDKGVRIAREWFDNRTYVKLYHKDNI